MDSLEINHLTWIGMQANALDTVEPRKCGYRGNKIQIQIFSTPAITDACQGNKIHLSTTDIYCPHKDGYTIH